MRKKSFVWIAAAVAVVVGAFLVLGGRTKAEPKYRTAKVELGDITQTVAATGMLSAVTTVKVGSVVSGNVAALHADFNKEVKKGDLLAELDPVPFQERVAQARAALEKAEVDVRNTEIGLRRQKALWDEKLAAQADLDQAQANFDSARAAVNQAKASLAQAETDLRNSRIDRADRRRRGRPPVRRRPAGGRVLHRADDLHDRAGPHEDAGLGGRLRIRHRDVQGRPAGALHRGRVSRPDVPRKDRADPLERHGQPERRDVPGDHRGREPRAGAAAEHDRERVDRRRRRA